MKKEKEMKLAAMQPYFFPYIGYFQLIDAADKIILYDHIKYKKKGWVNRNRIIEIGNGAVYITVPLKRFSSDQLISDIEIDNTENWGKKILNLLHHNYSKSAYYDEVYSFLDYYLSRKYDKLNILNIETISAVAELLNIKTPIVRGSLEYTFIEEDIKNKDYSLDTKNQRVIALCKYENAKSYINPIGGIKLYDKGIFKQNGIDLYFLETLKYDYKQLSQEFIPHLSIIDVLFNCGVKGTQQLIKNYQLI